jgi:hypothetical protein
MKLTAKQEKFCQAYIKLGDKSAAYREAYSTSKMKPGSINVKASELFKNGKITVRVQELQKEVKKKDKYTLEASIHRDLKLIQRYERALDILENIKSKPKAIDAAERTIKFIGANGYNSAQERLSKQHGFYEKDNEQKGSLVVESREERDNRIEELIRKRNAAK